MAIAEMTKVMVVAHHSEAPQLLEALQAEGILQVLGASEAAVSRQWPELQQEPQRPKELQDVVNRLDKSVTLLKEHSKEKKALAQILAPRPVVQDKLYSQVVSGREALEILHRSEEMTAKITELQSAYEHHCGTLDVLRPWQGLATPVEQFGKLDRTACLTGLIPVAHFEQTVEKLAELSAAVQQVGQVNNLLACVIVSLNESLTDVHKTLRAADFEPIDFEGMKGTVSQLIKLHSEKLVEISKQLSDEYEKAAALSGECLKLQILFDHYENLLTREQVRTNVPATEHAVFLEGWVRKRDLPRLGKLVAKFPASNLTTIEPAEDEQIPVEIDNHRALRPFEVITRLYGMPQHFEVDPTVFLAPFFALFFGVCLTDAGYGLLILAVAIYILKKMQGDKKIVWLLTICGVMTVLVGALTGGWFGDVVQQFVPGLAAARQKILLFDPLEEPMKLFILALVLGYVQIIVGLTVGFVHHLVRRDLASAVFEKLSWLIMLNSIVGLFLSNSGFLPRALSGLFPWTIIISAVVILFFSQREGGWGARIGMGVFQLFTTVFYIGDVLSYVRLMALGITTAALAMAINTIAKAVSGVPIIGIIFAFAVFAGGHAFNTALSALGAFAHTLRLQYVEFFPKFLVGGGRLFEPLRKEYTHIKIS